MRLEQAVKENKSGTLLIAEDKDGTPLSGAFLIWDSVKTYYLLGGLNSDLDTKGSQSLLLWEAIKLASNYSRIFDFEGAMDKSIEYFFRSFGSEQVQYFGIQRNNSFLARLLLNLKD